MPLDDREQRILEEIERQFYQDDPKLAETVRSTTLRRFTARKIRWAALVLVVGLAVMLGFFTRNPFVALGGFLAMVGAGFWIVTAITNRSSTSGPDGPSAWLDRARRRWRSGG